MITKNKALQNLVIAYMEDRQPWPATAREIAAWAIRERRWRPEPSSMIEQCSNQLSQAMRDEHIVDPQGRVVRAKHVAKIERNGELRLEWADIRTAPREHMHIAFQSRRQQIVGDCRQLKTDADSYNDNKCPDNPIQLIFDFTQDLAEIAAATYPNAS